MRVQELKGYEKIISEKEWEMEYQNICKLLKIDPRKDEKATKILSELLRERKDYLSDAIKVVKGKRIIIYGAGPSLEKAPISDYVKFAADGATSYLLKKKVFPEIIVSDLDGGMRDITKASKRGVVFVHAHGDNIKKLEKYVPRINKIVGTTQVKERRKVYNFGGFTDGDRCFFIAKALGAKEIEYYGMDFGDIIGRYSKPNLSKNTKASERKILKLKIAKNLLEKYVF
ncbi:MAG: 6-hydroxymethylpterin diphosphokinase MptE-like protein [Candidatus Methanofastidiosia archaeon]